MVVDNSSYKTIFKSTFLFGFVQVFNILAKVGINKAVAILLGTGGMGVIGLLQSTLQMLTTACGLGISQSAVKDIAQGANISQEQFSTSISLTKKLVLILAIFGAVATILLSPWLSEWTFGNNKYTYTFMLLSAAVFLNIISEGQLAILKGARMLRLLAKASLLGSIVGLLTGVPLYFWLGENGIVPSLIMASTAAAIFSWYFIRKIKYDKQHLSVKSAVKDGRVMIQMGIALMYVSLLGVVSDYIIRTYIGHIAGIDAVGLFQAGSMIVTSYFGIVITALTTDYYPRISAINQDNAALQIEFNRQSEVGLLLVGALVIVFLFAMPLFIAILYTDAFMPTIAFLQYAVFGILFTVCSNALGMLLLAKQASKTFFFTASIGRIIIIISSLISFHYWGLMGLGVATLGTGVFHLAFMSAVMWKKYRIKMNRGLYIMLITILTFSVIAFFVKDIDNLYIKYTLGLLLCGIYFIYALRQAKKTMGIDIIEFVRRKMKP